MKRYSIIVAALAVVVLAACGGGRPATVTTGGAVFEISPEVLSLRSDTLVDIGTVRSGEVVQYDARLLNTGAEPLVIKDINTSCGCTSVEYEKSPIAPDAEGRFSFRFDSRGMHGMQMKLIEIHTSASQKPYKVMVRAEVSEN